MMRSGVQLSPGKLPARSWRKAVRFQLVLLSAKTSLVMIGANSKKY